MKATYIQPGGNLDYKNNGDAAIEAGDVVVLGDRAGIAGTPIPVGELGSIVMDGVYKIAKKSGEAIKAGKDAYVSDEGITGTSPAPAEGGLPKIGYAVEDAAEGDAYVKVKLQA
ncbi:DUF2190 family protein [Clostridium sp. AF18-27]|uniref:DUF2190 family protein n=1 Tax=Enterocloster lavalensis TaxID=460384 RepID=UPI000E53079F|nr:DUF2190 family protein [Enterocloster lavalensis]RHR51967.1 DUF2190 family protein [Clostridium sp. AF18-27]